MKLNQIKFKYLTINELIINLDRLSRFKLPEESYPRVFHSILFKYLIFPKYSKHEIENLDPQYISKIVRYIWNKSVEKNFGIEKNFFNKKPLKYLINSTFKNIDKKTKIFINTELNISSILEQDNLPLNLKFLKYFLLQNNDIDYIRKKFALKFPIKKLVIVEGITEEILLPIFAKKLGYDFDKEGVYILGAGGKSKSPSQYFQLKDKLKIPVVILFDADAYEINKILKNKLLKKDKTILIQRGEFEDIISPYLIKRALNNEYKPASPLLLEEIKNSKKMCQNIEEFYKSRHLGEYKKSKVAKIIAENIKYKTDITDEIKNIILELI